jgi:Bifunctional DNA primase/polymerase, N-terminal
MVSPWCHDQRVTENSCRRPVTRIFATSAPIYRRAGWAGTLPLPEREKSDPPKGYTGREGTDPDDRLVADWSANGHGAGNIALRLPADVIGLDIDAYDTTRTGPDGVTRPVHKRGAETLAALESRLGALPPTFRSSARPAPSGVRLYRVPDGAAVTVSDLPGDIEIIRHGHRYMVAPPSVNPETDTAYMWTYGSGADWQDAKPPQVSWVPMLSAPWVELLCSKPAPERVPVDDFFLTPKTTETAAKQWTGLRDRVIGLVRRCEMFGWGGDAHGRLLELTRELAQLAPADAHRAIGEWFAAGGAGYVDDRVRVMLDSALGKYPSDKIVQSSFGHRPECNSGIGSDQKIVAPTAGGIGDATAGGHGATNDSNGNTPHMATAPPKPALGFTDGAVTGSGAPAHVRESTSGHAPGVSDAEETIAPRRLPMIPDAVWGAYGWSRSIRARARTADVCPDAVLGAMLATYAARIPPGVRIVTGTKMPLGTNLVVSLVGPSGSDKSTAFNLAQRISPGSAVPVIANPGSGEAFAASFVHADPDGEGAVSKRAKVLKPDPRALFYVAEGALVGSIGSRLGSTWLPHLRALAVDESLSTTNATSEINRQVPAQSYSAGVVVGFQVTTATTILHDTGTGTAQRFLWFSSLSTEDPGPAELAAAGAEPEEPMATPVLTRLGAGIDEENRPIHYLMVTQAITDRIRAEQRHYRMTRDITATDDHDAHRHTLVAKLAALAVLADGRVLIEERDWGWAEALYAASGAVRDELLAIAEETERDRRVVAGAQMGQTDRARRGYDGEEARVAEIILRRVDKLGGQVRRKDVTLAVKSKDRHLLAGALEQLEKHGYLRYRDGVWSRLNPQQ